MQTKTQNQAMRRTLSNTKNIILDGVDISKLRKIFYGNTIFNPMNGCLEWTSHTTERGYGLIFFEKKKYKAHRLAYEMEIGHIEYGMCVCHHCDNPKCVNTNHLFVGTMKDNVRDMINKGRFKNQNGEKNGLSKLTNKQVLLIRADGRTSQEIANKYGVTRANISCIKHRKTWKHV